MIHFVSGKGGVGKSTIAAALAWKLATEGRRTLLVELGARGYFRHIFQMEVSSQPVALTSQLSVVRWAGEDCLREYIRHLIKIDRVVTLFFDNKIMQALIEASPALRELALLGKITSGVRRVGPELPFDDLVVDAYATGHFRALWRAPIGLSEAIPFGPMGDQSRGIVQALRNPEQSRFYVTMIPEDLPVTEGLELAQDIESEMGQQARLILNRWLNPPLTLEQLRQFQGHEFADYLLALLERQERCLRQIRERGRECVELPWLLTDNAAEKVRHLAGEIQ